VSLARVRVPGELRAGLSAGRGIISFKLLQASIVLLIATVLWQRPLLAIRSGDASLLVRPWDVVWLLVLLASAAALLSARPCVSLRGITLRDALRSPLALLFAYAALGAISLSWCVLAFRSDGLPAAVVGAGRLVAVAYLAAVLVLFWSDRLARILRIVFLASALIAAAMAVWAYQFSMSAAGVGVTRAGGPFGNYFADVTADRWWAYPAGSTELGYWLAAAVIVLCPWALDPAWRNGGSLKIRAACGVAALLLLVGTLALTHSRESWVAVAGGALVVAYGLRDRISLRHVAAAVVVVALALLVLVPSLGNRLSATFQPGTYEYITGPQARWESWTDGVRIGNDRFPIGWGITGVSAHDDRFGRRTAENVFLQSYMETGLLGFTLLLGLVVGGARAGLRRLRAVPSDPAAGLAVALLAVLGLHGVFGNTLGDPSVQVLLGVAIASATAAAAARDPAVDRHP
jgi:O-antigen ligase